MRWLYIFFLSLIVSALAFKIFQPVQVLPRIRLAPAFSLIAQNGERLTSDRFQGQITLYTFTYTRCLSPCVNPDKTMQEIQRRLAEEPLVTPVNLVSISFDPKHDTPDILQRYALHVGAEAGKWYIATTYDENLLKTIIGAGFEVYYQPRADGGFDFSPVFILVDGWGIIRGEYRYQTEVPTAERILRHLRVLDEEVRNSHGVAKLAYEAAHLFLCYAQ